MSKPPQINFKKALKLFLAGGAVVLLSIQLILPLATYAQSPEENMMVIAPVPPGLPVIISGNVYEEAKKKVGGFFDNLSLGAITILMNTFQVFTQRIATDLAQAILTGDTGQYPMFWQEGFGDYLKNVAEDAGNQFLSDINSEYFNTLGFDLCTPMDPFKLQLSWGLSGKTNRLQQTCNAAKIGAAWEQTKASFETTKDVFDNIAPMYDPSASELNVGIRLYNNYLDVQSESQLAAELDRQETQGWKTVKSIISGKIETPSDVAREAFYETAIKSPMENNSLNYSAMMGNAFKMGFTQLGVLTASTFLNTLVNGLLQKFLTGLAGSDTDVAAIDFSAPDSVTNSNVARARIVFSDLLTPNLYSSAQRDFVTELAGCPTPRGLFNCAMDEGMATALRTVGESGAYTVGQAAHLSQNNEPPSNPAFLHKEWELIPDADVKNNTDPTCYQRAYCASNLAKLRYARILPVGWEMAANSPYNTKKAGKYVTLEEVVRGFYVCDDKGQADSSHPWCKLIDPNWVMAAPPFNCSIKGYGNTVFDGTAMRLQECADAMSCLKRDDRGKCTGGYGYCLAEKPVWRFTADICLERFSSCRTYQTRDKQRVSYLRNTIDYGACSADNVGCLWYSSERDTSDPTGNAWSGEIAGGPRKYFDATIKTCTAANDGCTKLLEVYPGNTSLNLAQNGSFEQFSDEQNKKLVAWEYQDPKIEYAVPVVGEGEESVHGNQGFEVKSNTLWSGRVTLGTTRNYTLSAYIRNLKADQAGSLDLLLQMYKTTSTDDAVASGKFFRSEGCSQLVKEGPYAGFEENIQPGEDSIVWKRVVCSFVSNAGTVSGKIRIGGSNILVDAIQLEEGEVATNFVDGLASGLAEKYLKVPPDELNCSGAKNDHASCSKYARVCSQNDTGCQGYRDANNPTAPEIPAALSAVDFCPAACVGYGEYRKQASTFDLGKSLDERLNDPKDIDTVHFIPAYSQQCSLQDVGCEEFTNIEEAKVGGEQKMSFNYVRACEKPSENTQTYFTWEGSDVAGYQLRTWSLIRQDEKSTMPKLIQKMGPEGILKNPTACNDALWQSGADPDCRQLFDEDGKMFYAYFSQTVVSSPDCKRYRLEKSNADDCTKTGGIYDAVTTQCVYQVLAAESRQCSKVSAGCRAYIGTTGRNTTIALQESFRGSTSTPFTFGVLSNEAVLVGDQSLLIADPKKDNQDLNTATVFKSGANQLFSISFWAKTTNPKKPVVQIWVDGKEIASFAMEVDWRRYEFGPFTTASSIDKSIITWNELPNPTFIDEIRIERLLDVTYTVKDSWIIPAECDRTPEGLPEPRAMLGCRAYKDRDGKAVNVRRFGHLCREDAVGCKAFIDTRDSENPYADTFVIKGTNTNTKIDKQSQEKIQPAFDYEDKYVGSATTTRPADLFRYLIDEPGARCDAANASCRAFGKPKFAQDQLAIELPTSSAFETVYLIDDIKQYVTADGTPNMLCRKDELFCDEFKSGKTIAYFRNPQSHVCEWRDKAVLKKNIPNGIPQDGEYNGWFRKGTDLPCYPNALSSGNSYLIRRTADMDYWGWVGMCPIEQSECTEFRDTNDTSDPLHSAGKPYYFIKNQRLDMSSCGGKVNLQRGCILFRDMADPRVRYSTAATYNKSKAEGDIPQAPIDCVGDPDNAFCKKCTNFEGSYVKPEAPKFWDTFTNKCVNETVFLYPSLLFDEQGLKTAEEACKNAVNTTCNLGEKFSLAPFMSFSCFVDKLYPDIKKAKDAFNGTYCFDDSSCSMTVGNIAAKGICTKQVVKNDANAVVKVKLDRDCAQWLGCSTAETVYDSVQQKYVDVCTETAVCDAVQGVNAGAFCANYVNRDGEKILKPGVFFTREVYTARKTGFGEIDYSGYMVPDQFLAADIENRKVGSEIFEKLPGVANKYALDYRLAAAVPESTGLIDFGVDAKEYPDMSICRHKQTGRDGYYESTIQKPDRVCYFAVDALSERAVGFDQQKTVDPRSIRQLADVFRVADDPLNNTTLQRSFPPAECKAYPESDSPFPNLYVNEWDTAKTPVKRSEVAVGYESANYCEYGENCACSYRKVKYGGQVTRYFAPFGSPPPGGICVGGRNDGGECIPGEKKATGSAGPNITQTIEDDPACPGGTCEEISDVILVRGQYGQCLQRDYSRFVANDPARHPCLVWNPTPILASTYDANHYVPSAGYNPPVNAGEFYCLSPADPPFETVWDAMSHTDWNDSKVKGTEKAGPNGDGANTYFYLPGSLSKFNYDTGYIAGKCSGNSNPCSPGEDDCSCLDGSSSSEELYGFTSADRDYEEMYLSAVVKPPNEPYNMIDKAGGYTDCHRLNKDWTDDDCDEIWRFQNLGVGIDGVKPFSGGQEGPQASHCAAAHNGGADNDHGGPPGAADDVNVKDGIGPLDKAPDMDANYGRWIQTGRGLGRTYTEYFVAAKAEGVAKWLNPDASKDALKGLKYDAVRERNIAQFQFYPKCDAYSAACSLPTWYVDGVKEPDYTDAAQVANASKQVCSAFSKDFDGMLDRSKEGILVDANLVPRQATCSGVDGDTDKIEGDKGKCYYKYWETNYRMDGVTKFLWLDQEADTPFRDRRYDYYSREAPCSKSGFSIRALFENASPEQNSKPPKEVKIAELTGPWNFIGFWISACTVGSNNYESALYLGLRVKHADICTDIAQVISPYTRESATFADRVWNRGNFVIPQVGFSYSSQYQPYGSALATGKPGKDPLFQTGGPVENYSKLDPPTFIGSGPSYVTLKDSPVYKWSYLTNVFARIYRIYKYEDSVVTKESWACVGGVNHGKPCPANADAEQEKAYCSGIGKCDTTLTAQGFKNSVHRCNGLSGVNAGLDCGTGFGMASDDPVCHNAAVKNIGGMLEPQYTACELRAGWSICVDPAQYSKPGIGDGKCYGLPTVHEKYNAFGCKGDAVLPGAGCTEPNAKSKDCPLKVTGIPCIKDSFGQMAGHCGGGYEHARCSANAVDAGVKNPSASSECVFTISQWWGAYDDGKGDTSSGGAEVTFEQTYKAWVGTVTHIATLYPTEDGSIGPFTRKFLPFDSKTGEVPSANDMSQIYRSRGWHYETNSKDEAEPLYHSDLTLPFSARARWGSVSLLSYADNATLFKRWPTPHIVVEESKNMPNQRFVRPGLCEGAEDALQDPNNDLKKNKTELFNKFPRKDFSLKAGQCNGGINDGQACFSKSDVEDPSWPHPNTCEPAQAAKAGKCLRVVKLVEGFPPIDDCKLDSGDSSVDANLDEDNNSCTHGAGYQPRADICNGSNIEKCLLGYDLGNEGTKQKSLNYQTLAPTDVTQGWHTPSFLGYSAADPAQEAHIAYYAPRPPTIAAPDTSRTCPAPGTCPISAANAFTLENQSAGALTFGGGKAIVSMKFYGWAAHEQTPLTDAYIDWGDGTQTSIESVRMKNKKPFCGGTRECELIDGLTCQSDADCPPAGGKCAERGVCSNEAGKACFRDQECQLSGLKDAKCQIRELFGNSDEACEQNYFEFTHAYSCGKELEGTKCGTEKRCSRNPKITCTDQTVLNDCGPGDTCEEGLAPSGGCWDTDNVVCRYTPKVMLKDNWNWCTGECRAGIVKGKEPTDISSAKVRHVYGGCWDGGETYKNTAIKDWIFGKTDINECELNPVDDKNIRPWIVYPGAIQIGIIQ